jgi:hypothetical protein
MESGFLSRLENEAGGLGEMAQLRGSEDKFGPIFGRARIETGFLRGKTWAEVFLGWHPT